MKLGGFLKKSDLFILSKITLLAHQVVTGQSKPTALRNQRELVDSLTGKPATPLIN